MKDWITYKELVALGPWSRRHWQRLVRLGRIKSRRPGHRTVMISRQSVEIYLAIR